MSFKESLKMILTKRTQNPPDNQLTLNNDSIDKDLGSYTEVVSNFHLKKMRFTNYEVEVMVNQNPASAMAST